MHIILKKRSENKFHIQLSKKTLRNTQGKLKNRSITCNSSLSKIKALLFTHFQAWFRKSHILFGQFQYTEIMGLFV